MSDPPLNDYWSRLISDWKRQRRQEAAKDAILESMLSYYDSSGTETLPLSFLEAFLDMLERQRLCLEKTIARESRKNKAGQDSEHYLQTRIDKYVSDRMADKIHLEDLRSAGGGYRTSYIRTLEKIYKEKQRSAEELLQPPITRPGTYVFSDEESEAIFGNYQRIYSEDLQPPGLNQLENALHRWHANGDDLGPPKLGQFLLVLFLAEREDRISAPGDLEEEYRSYILESFGLRKAKLWYWKQILTSIVPILGNWLARTARWIVIIAAAVITLMKLLNLLR